MPAFRFPTGIGSGLRVVECFRSPRIRPLERVISRRTGTFAAEEADGEVRMCARARHPLCSEGCPCAAFAASSGRRMYTLLSQNVCDRLSPKEVGLSCTSTS